MHTYLSAALELGRIQIPPGFDRYRLFDSQGISRRADGDWHRFLARFLAYKLTQVRPYLERDVQDFPEKMAQLSAILVTPYTGEYRLVHGDFFPGNLLVDAERQVMALLDFGLLTMYGDALFDIATGWVFFDMYDELKANLRQRYLSILLERLGENVRGKLYLYMLLYSVLSANTYSPTCSDGHYRWCVANLNHREYWVKVE
jgi:fructosamine-3-kinase